MTTTIQKLIDQVEKQEGSDAPEKVKNSAKEIVSKVLLDGVPPKEAMGFNDEMLEYLYKIAYNLFKNGKYKNAIPLFTFLRDLDPLVYRYTFAIASSYHHMKDYQKALGEYSLCSLLDPNDPKCYYYMADCCLELKDAALAISSLQDALLRSKDKPEFADIYKVCQLNLDQLQMEGKES